MQITSLNQSEKCEKQIIKLILRWLIYGDFFMLFYFSSFSVCFLSFLFFLSCLKCFFVDFSVLIPFNLWMDFFVGFFSEEKNVFNNLSSSLSCLLRKQVINLVKAFIFVYLVCWLSFGTTPTKFQRLMFLLWWINIVNIYMKRMLEWKKSHWIREIKLRNSQDHKLLFLILPDVRHSTSASISTSICSFFQFLFNP